jgi:hypothetical protein
MDLTDPQIPVPFPILGVFLGGAISEISGASVRLHAVSMKNFHSIRPGAYKRPRHQCMNRDTLATTVAREMNPRVSIFIVGTPQNAGRPCVFIHCATAMLAIMVDDAAWQSPDTAKVRHLVEPLPALNGPPNLTVYWVGRETLPPLPLMRRAHCRPST